MREFRLAGYNLVPNADDVWEGHTWPDSTFFCWYPFICLLSSLRAAYLPMAAVMVASGVSVMVREVLWIWWIGLQTAIERHDQLLMFVCVAREAGVVAAVVLL